MPTDPEENIDPVTEYTPEQYRRYLHGLRALTLRREVVLWTTDDSDDEQANQYDGNIDAGLYGGNIGGAGQSWRSEEALHGREVSSSSHHTSSNVVITPARCLVGRRRPTSRVR